MQVYYTIIIIINDNKISLMSARNHYEYQFKSNKIYQRNEQRLIQQSSRYQQLKEKLLIMTNSNELLNRTLRQLRQQAQYYLKENEYLKQELKIKNLDQLEKKQQYQNVFLQLQEQNRKLIRLIEQKIVENKQLHEKIKGYSLEETKLRLKNQEIESLKQEIQTINRNFHIIKSNSELKIYNQELKVNKSLMNELQVKNRSLQSEISEMKANNRSIIDKELQQITKNLNNKIYEQQTKIITYQTLIQQLQNLNNHLQSQINQNQHVQSSENQQKKLKYSNSQYTFRKKYESQQSNQSSEFNVEISDINHQNQFHQQKQLIIQQLRKQNELLQSKLYQVMKKFDDQIQKFKSYEQKLENYKNKSCSQKEVPKQYFDSMENFYRDYENEKKLYQEKIKELFHELILEKTKLKEIQAQSNYLKAQKLKLQNQISMWKRNI